MRCGLSCTFGLYMFFIAELLLCFFFLIFFPIWVDTSLGFCIEVAIGRAGPGQQWAGPKSGRAKIGPVFSGQNFNSPARQPALKTGPVGPNSLFKTKKIRAGRAKFGPVFFGTII